MQHKGNVQFELTCSFAETHLTDIYSCVWVTCRGKTFHITVFLRQLLWNSGKLQNKIPTSLEEVSRSINSEAPLESLFFFCFFLTQPAAASLSSVTAVHNTLIFHQVLTTAGNCDDATLTAEKICAPLISWSYELYLDSLSPSAFEEKKRSCIGCVGRGREIQEVRTPKLKLRRSSDFP